MSRTDKDQTPPLTPSDAKTTPEDVFKPRNLKTKRFDSEEGDLAAPKKPRLSSSALSSSSQKVDDVEMVAFESLDVSDTPAQRMSKTSQLVARTREILSEYGFGKGKKLLSKAPVATYMGMSTKIYYEVLHNLKADILLCQGGVPRTFVRKLADLKVDPDTEFAGYLSDHPSQYEVSQDNFRKFLLECGLIDKEDTSSYKLSLGSVEGYSRAYRAFSALTKNGNIFFPKNAYGFFAEYTQAIPTGGLVMIDTDPSGKIILASLQKAITGFRRTKILYLDAKTMNGAFYTKVELEAVVRLCNKNGIYMIYDMTHFKIYFDPTGAVQMQTITDIARRQGYNKFVITSTTSKTLGWEQLRLGFLIVADNEEIREPLTLALRTVIGGSIPAPQMKAFYELIHTDSRERETFLEEQSLLYHQNLKILLAHLYGVDHAMFSREDVDFLKTMIPEKYQKGNLGNFFGIVNIPQGGYQAVLGTSKLYGKFFEDIEIENSLDVCCILAHRFKTLCLFGLQILDDQNNCIRVAFCDREVLLRGLENFQKFAENIKDRPLTVAIDKKGKDVDQIALTPLFSALGKKKKAPESEVVKERPKDDVKGGDKDGHLDKVNLANGSRRMKESIRRSAAETIQSIVRRVLRKRVLKITPKADEERLEDVPFMLESQDPAWKAHWQASSSDYSAPYSRSLSSSILSLSSSDDVSLLEADHPAGMPSKPKGEKVVDKGKTDKEKVLDAER